MLRHTTVLTHVAKASPDIVRENLVARKDLSLNTFYLPPGRSVSFQPMRNVERLHILLAGACTVYPGENAFKVERGTAVAIPSPGAHRIQAARQGVALATIAFRHPLETAEPPIESITILDLIGPSHEEAAAQLATWADRPAIGRRAYLMSPTGEPHRVWRVLPGAERFFLVLEGKLSVETVDGATWVESPDILSVPPGRPHRTQIQPGTAPRVLILSDAASAEDILNHFQCGPWAARCPLAHHHHDGLLTLDPDGAILEQNEDATRLLGLQSTVRGESIFPYLHPEDARWLSGRLREPGVSRPTRRDIASPVLPGQTLSALFVPHQGQHSLRQALLFLRHRPRHKEPVSDLSCRDLRGSHREDGGAEEFVALSPAMARMDTGLSSLARSNLWAIVQGQPATGRTTVARRLHRCGSNPEAPFEIVDCQDLEALNLPDALVTRSPGPSRRCLPGPLLESMGHGTILITGLHALPGKILSEILRRLAALHASSFPLPRIVVELERTPHQGLPPLRPADPFPLRGPFALISLPPLHERRQDVPGLLDTFFRRLSGNHPTPLMSNTALEYLLSHPLPNNLEDLQRLAGALLVLPLDGPVTQATVRALLQPQPQPTGPADQPPQTLAACERQLIERTLEQTGGNKSEAARRLGIPRARLSRLIAKHHLDA